jgi:diguanylate cyclase (GGDEF)-like protein
MKTHTIKGSEILKDIDTIEGLDTGARYHHERYDGKGYPNGLKGEEIPLIARIICIADAYDAMTSNRIYRKRLTEKIVRDEIVRCRGTQFDPEVTDAFLSCLDSGRMKEALLESTEGKSDVGNRILKSFMEDQAKLAIENSEKDILTGVYNRNAGMNRIQEAMKTGYGCLFLLNLNEMWLINRKHGFRQGDYYIQTVAHILVETKEEIIISRFKGDEFLCYVPEMVEEEAINQFMDQIKEACRNLPKKNPSMDPIKTSIGAVVHANMNEKMENLIFDASKAVFYVKRTFEDGAYLYQKVSHNTSEISRDELSNLIQLLKQKDNYSQWAILDKEDFKRLFQMIFHVIQEQNERGLLMFTVKPVDEKNILVEEREKAIQLLEAAILKKIDDNKRVFNYSSMQYIVVIPEGVDPEQLGNDILNQFYLMYKDKKVEAFFDLQMV